MDGDKVFMLVCGQMYTECVFDDCQKKVGQRISHHLLRGRGMRGERRREGREGGGEETEGGGEEKRR